MRESRRDRDRDSQGKPAVGGHRRRLFGRRSAAMAMVGHKTEAICRHYAIVDAGALREAAEKIDRANFKMSFGKLVPGCGPARRPSREAATAECLTATRARERAQRTRNGRGWGSCPKTERAKPRRSSA